METIRTRQLEQENSCLRKSLSVALDMLIVHEPPDSRAVSDEFVAMAAVQSGDMSLPVMQVIDRAIQFLPHRGEEKHSMSNVVGMSNPNQWPPVIHVAPSKKYRTAIIAKAKEWGVDDGRAAMLMIEQYLDAEESEAARHP